MSHAAALMMPFVPACLPREPYIPSYTNGQVADLEDRLWHIQNHSNLATHAEGCLDAYRFAKACIHFAPLDLEEDRSFTLSHNILDCRFEVGEEIICDPSPDGQCYHYYLTSYVTNALVDALFNIRRIVGGYLGTLEHLHDFSLFSKLYEPMRLKYVIFPVEPAGIFTAQYWERGFINPHAAKCYIAEAQLWAQFMLASLHAMAVHDGYKKEDLPSRLPCPNWLLINRALEYYEAQEDSHKDVLDYSGDADLNNREEPDSEFKSELYLIGQPHANRFVPHKTLWSNDAEYQDACNNCAYGCHMPESINAAVESDYYSPYSSPSPAASEPTLALMRQIEDAMYPDSSPSSSSDSAVSFYGIIDWQDIKKFVSYEKAPSPAPFVAYGGSTPHEGNPTQCDIMWYDVEYLGWSLYPALALTHPDVNIPLPCDYQRYQN